jgi:hypothetical protein
MRIRTMTERLRDIYMDFILWINCGPQPQQRQPEAEFLDVIGTKVLRVFLLAIHSHLY